MPQELTCRKIHPTNNQSWLAEWEQSTPVKNEFIKNVFKKMLKKIEYPNKNESNKKRLWHKMTQPTNQPFKDHKFIFHFCIK